MEKTNGNDQEIGGNGTDIETKEIMRKVTQKEEDISLLMASMADYGKEMAFPTEIAKQKYDKKLEEKKQEFLKMVPTYREKEKSYQEEETRLNNLLQQLNDELRLSEQKDKEDYLASLEKKEVNEEKIPESGVLSSDINKIIEEIPKKEKKIIEKAMEEDTPMEFESKKTKTNYKEYIKNNVVKLLSGFKISPEIKKILEKNARKIMITTAVLTIWTAGGSFVKPNNVKGDIEILKSKEIANATKKDKSLEKVDIDTYSKLSESGKKIYLYANSKINESYIIIDKPTATLSVIGADKKLVCQIPVLLGKMKGETPNKADPDSDIAVGATTPAGKYTFGKLGITEEDMITYKGKIFKIVGSDGLALHITYPPEKEKRTKAITTPTPDDNRMSWGCINVSEEVWSKYIEGNISNRGTILFITPDDPLASVNAETGRVEKISTNNLLAMNNINN